MKHLLNKLGWWFDYYFAYFLYNGNKRHRYQNHMREKYPNKKFENSLQDLEKYQRGRSKY
jgi:hypothetical protein